MDKLVLESDSSDTRLEIVFKQEYKLENLQGIEEFWLDYELKIFTGEKEYSFNSIDREAITHTGMISEIGKFMFAVKPFNELEQLKKSLTVYLEAKQKSFVYEPGEPSFELEIERTVHSGQFGSNEEEFKVYFWIDSGNTTQLEYTWDGIGLRFVTTKSKLVEFLAGINVADL